MMEQMANRNVCRRWWKTGRDGDGWMSDGSEFRRRDAATGNARRPTVVSRNDGEAVDVMMTSEVGDDQVGRRHEQDRSGLVVRKTTQHTKRHDSHLEVDTLW